ncbi:MAG: helix-turn-helix domain-containing protein, partial [Actinobacteria bacterium]|nr:helix-turn-helix domain-containing protein [Actinomycetota bacterium]
MSQRRTTGNLVLAGREAKGLSLRRAARRLGMSPRALRNWEKGRESIPYAVRQAMVTLYGIPPELLTPARPSAG